MLKLTQFWDIGIDSNRMLMKCWWLFLEQMPKNNENRSKNRIVMSDKCVFSYLTKWRTVVCFFGQHRISLRLPHQHSRVICILARTKMKPWLFIYGIYAVIHFIGIGFLMFAKQKIILDWRHDNFRRSRGNRIDQRVILEDVNDKLELLPDDAKYRMQIN